QIQDYTNLGLMGKLDEPRMVQLRQWVDPYSYRQRYTMPKLLLLGTNDRYWTVDSLRNYWRDLPAPKLIYQTPNAGHDLGGGKEAIQSLAAWFALIADHQPLPQMDWQIAQTPAGASLAVELNRPARALRLWTATSPTRDFREAKWTARELEVPPGGERAAVAVPQPAQGFRAFLVEVELTSPTGQPYRLSTEARVTPDTVP
ncbi:MAG: PhoPQ-activated pathogenicity-like protein PqaA type, partial [Verrucomicrobia bacterium]|nr:PhoPQ-activated pathogenicity-like protein PqaA type [Verrucomicrobiota bacterium]